MRFKNSVRLALLLLLGLPARGADRSDPAAPFFGPDKLHTLHLTLTPEAWDLMQPTRRPRPLALVADQIPAPTTQPTAATPPTPRTDKTADDPRPPAVEGDKLAPNNFGFEYVYVRAKLTVDDASFTDVALRFKGNASYANYANTPRRPYKVDFDRFVPRRKFLGLASLNLSNNAFDNSQLRESLSYEVYRRAGVPAPRTALAVLYLTVPGQYDHAYVGAFTIVEDVDDKPFLKTHFDATDGLLMKPEGIRGLPYMGEEIATYDQRYHLKTNHPDPAAARSFIEFLKLVNYADDATFRREIPRRLDVDGLLRYLAATVLICNLDSVLSTHHNFYLYTHPADGRVRVLPWDMNLSFAGYGGGGGRGGADQANLSITHPWGGENRLLERVLGIPEYDRAYRAHLRAFVQDFYNEPAMHALVDRMKAALKPADLAAAAAKQPLPSNEPAGTGRGFGGTRDTLKTFITRRIPSVLDQLDDQDTPAFIPRANPAQVPFAWALRAKGDFGPLTKVAQEIRKSADTDGDYQLSLPEALAAADTLFGSLADPLARTAKPTPGQSAAPSRTPSPDTDTDTTPVAPKDLSPLDRQQLAKSLTPLLADAAPHSRGRNLLDIFRTPAPSDAATAWSTVLLTAADTDHDKLLSQPELALLASRLFCLADRDHNNHLDERELAEALDLLATSPSDLTAPHPPAR